MHLIEDEDGSQVIEYCLLVAIVAIALAMALPPLQRPVCSLAGRVSDYLGATWSPACAGNPGRGDGGTGTGNGNGQGNGNGKGQGGGNGVGLQ